MVLGALSLKDFLVAEEVVDSAAIDRASNSSQKTGQSLVSILVNLGLISPAQMVEILSQLSGYDVIKADDLPDTPLDLPDLNPVFLKLHRVLPVREEKGTLIVATADPTDSTGLEGLKFALGKEVTPFIASFDTIEETIKNLYFPEEANSSGGDDNYTYGAEDDLERLKELAGNAPVIRFVDKTISRAVAAGASDIHFEPMERRFRVRFRLDGVLHDVDSPDKGMEAAVVSRLKILAGLDIAERRLSQDGRFKMRIDGKEIDFRMSTGPSTFGESVVLRILDRAGLPDDFAALGFQKGHIKALQSALKAKDGMVLVTGPTGSGKTTTLYAALQGLNSDDRKILSIEDPVEYLLDGVTQVQVDARIGRTFANALRSFLRQDPDIMMVGEIRDGETAEIATQASLTGHLVLSTLHTNDAASAITRLMDMGVDDFLIASTLRLIVAQRLVRKLCPKCSVEAKLSAAEKAQLKSLGTDFGQVKTHRKPKGCKACSNTGYSGRTVIAEVLPITDQIRALIKTGISASEIAAKAKHDGGVSLLDAGLDLAGRGVTSLDEILRVTRG